MAKFDIYATFLYSWEGGFVNNPNDPGGATNKGVTLATWTSYCHKHGVRGNVATLKAMNNSQWKDIMKGMYWDKLKGDEIKCQGVANMVVDFGINAGIRTAAIALQKACGATPDGIVGQETLALANGMKRGDLFVKLWNIRMDYYRSLANQNSRFRTFLNGWENRVKSLKLQSFILNDRKRTEIFFE